MFARSISFIVCLAFLVSASSNSMAYDGWAGDPFSPTTKVSTDPPKKSWIPKPSMPSWFKSNKQSSKPSTISKMGKTTKRWWNNTLSALDPYPNDKGKETNALVRTQEPKSSWWGGKKKEKAAADQDVNAFLSLPKPQ